ncbi:MAG: tetratricopeptide repeat protein, partial [Bacteroidia bacterium]|nr:tetratricopeptide repeat protein [Bacteroidia bacterium]
MSQVKQYILAFLLLYGACVFAQESEEKNIKALSQTLKFHVEQSELDIERSQFFIAEENLQKALGFAKEINDKKSEGNIHTRIAKIHFTLGKYDRALSSVNKALEIQRLSNDYANQAETYNVRGLIYAKKNEHKIAWESYKSSKTYSGFVGLEEYVAEVLLNSSVSLIAMKDYKEAIQDLERSIALSKKYDIKDTESSALINTAKALFYLGNYDRALLKAKAGLELAEEIKYQAAKNEAYLILSDIYQSTEEFSLANEYLKAHINLRDSIYALKSANLDAESKLQYAESDREKLVAKQAEDLAKLKKESNLTQLISLLSIALITILSLLTLSLYKNNNIRTRTNNMLYKKNEDLMIAKERAELASKTKANFLSTVTHELRTPLYAVTGLTNMLLDEDPKPNQVNHLKSLKFSGEYLLAFINDILQLNKIEAEKVN